MSEYMDSDEAMLAGLPPFPGYAEGTSPLFLILGSFPSRASLAVKTYYAHPRNHFWRIVGEIFDIDLEKASSKEKSAFLRMHRIIIWDSIAACRRSGSLDNAIQDAVPNDIAGLLERFPSIRAVGLNGLQSARVFFTRVLPEPAKVPAIGEILTLKITKNRPTAVFIMRLPSTSPVPTRAYRDGASKIPHWEQFFTIHL